MLHFHRKNVSKGKTGLPGRLTALGLAAALCASYLLVPPAAAEVDYICGMTEHTHTAACYQRVCGKEEIFSHTHVRECYDEDNHLICTLTERTLHHHSESCYSKPQPICGLEESEEHTHTAECYPADFQPELICGQEDIPEHRHTADCYRLVCTLPEHLHAAGCVRVVEETTEPEVTEPTEETQEPEAASSMARRPLRSFSVLPPQWSKEVPRTRKPCPAASSIRSYSRSKAICGLLLAHRT